MQGKVSITFCGGTHNVTGANFLISDGVTNILVDCGLYQGTDETAMLNYEPFPFDVTSIHYLIITHAHEDHIGRIPKIIKEGFAGTILSTQATKDLAYPMLMDSVGLLADEAKRKGRPVLYTEKDVEASFVPWKGIPYHNNHKLGENFTVELYDAGHVLGSAMALFSVHGKRLLCTGDMGNTPNLLLRDTEIVPDVDYLLMESVYGDRNHEHRDERAKLLHGAITDTIARGGVAMLPVFSLERAQEMLMEINEWVEAGTFPRVPMYFDSPLAIKLTDVFKKHVELFNTEARHKMQKGDDLFAFKGLKRTVTSDESKAIVHNHGPKIIMAGSGMLSGGRMIHHIEHYISDKRSMLIFTGYQAPGTLGRVIQGGLNPIWLYGKKVPVHAEIRSITGYSGHKDSDHLVQFVESLAESNTLKKVFTVMGEPDSALFLSQKIRDTVGVTAIAPNRNETIVLE